MQIDDACHRRAISFTAEVDTSKLMLGYRGHYISCVSHPMTQFPPEFPQ